MRDPGHWFWLVLWIEAVHAVMAAVSLGWLMARILPTPSVSPFGLERLATPLLAAVSVFLPFLAYAGDSRTMLQRYPEDSCAGWQAIGGLVGVSLLVIVLHVTICIRTLRSDFPDNWLMVYKLLFPTLIVGGLGAAAGIAAALLVYSILRGGDGG
jgi:hypothetical protein